MKTRIWLIAWVCFLFGTGTPGFAEGSGLVDLLVQSLGVTTQQAEGGAGAVFNTAKQNMESEDFLQVTNAMPEVEPLMASAPTVEQGSGSLGGISSMLGQSSGSLGNMASLYSSFSELGLSKEMVGQFIPVILDYAQTKGGATVSNLLKAALQ